MVLLCLLCRMNADPPVPGFTQPTITVPSASLPLNSALPLFAALTSKQMLQLTFADARLPTNRFERCCRLALLKATASPETHPRRSPGHRQGYRG